MKKILFISIITFTLLPLFSQTKKADLQFTTKGVFNLEPDKENTFTGSGGFSLSLNALNLRGFASIPKTEFPQISDTITSKNPGELFSDQRWSARTTLFRNTLPFIVAAGSLSFTKAVSRTKNPVPSLPSSPVQKTFSRTCGIGLTLPGISSTQKPLSYFLNLDFIKTGLPLNLQAAFNPEDSSAFFCAETRFRPAARAEFQTSLLFSSTVLENNSSFLKEQNCLFEKQRSGSVLWECFFNSPFLKLNFYSGIQQNPFGITSLYLNSKIRLSAGNFLLDASYFAIPTSENSPKAVPLISSNGTLIKTVEQSSINPQLIFLTKEGTLIRTGLTASQTWKITGTSYVSTIDVGKISAGILLEKKHSSLKASFSAANLLFSGSPPAKSSVPDKFYEFSMSCSSKQPLWNGNFSLKCRQYPPKASGETVRQILSADTSATLGKLRSLKLSAGLDLSAKNSIKDSGKYSLGVQWKVQKKHFSSSLQVTLNQKF